MQSTILLGYLKPEVLTSVGEIKKIRCLRLTGIQVFCHSHTFRIMANAISIPETPTLMYH